MEGVPKDTIESLLRWQSRDKKICSSNESALSKEATKIIAF